MSGPKFNSQISLGNIISLVTFLIGILGVWFQSQSQIQENTLKLDQSSKTDARFERRVASMENLISEVNSHVVQLEISNARTDERVGIILQGIAEIKASLPRGGAR